MWLVSGCHHPVRRDLAQWSTALYGCGRMIMYYLRLIKSFMRASIQAELAYHANFFISLLHSVLNLGTGVLGLVVLFSQVGALHGWDFSATLALLGTYL